jgi:signal transduction histidine kinase
MEARSLHQLLEEDKTSALMANFALLFPGSFNLWLVDVAGRLVGYHPVAARDVDVQNLLPALERVQQLRHLIFVPIGVATPVWVRGQPAGALIAETPDDSESNWASALQFLARIISLLAENRLAREELLKDSLTRYRELRLLYRAGEMMAASLDLAEINRLILNESSKLVRAQEGAVMLRDRESGQLTVWASSGLDAVEDIGAGIPRGHELAAEVVRTGKTEIRAQPASGDGNRPLSAVLCVPLKTKDEVLGVISLAHTDSESSFDAKDTDLINAMAAQAAVAIENAQMFSDLSALHNELEAANRRLRELDKLKSSFLGVITHELRSPLAHVDFSLQLIERYGTAAWPEEQREQWTHLVSGFQEAKVMIDNLVSFAGLLSRQGDLQLTEVDFPPLINDVAETLSEVIRSRGLELFVDGAESLPLIRADEGRLKDATYHLVYNAIKFNRPGGSIHVHYSCDDRGLTFEVQDTGIGIPAEKLGQLWDSFSQVADPLKRGREGLGLGLALVQYVVRAHGGWVDATSQEGVGSTFRFWLPRNGPARTTLPTDPDITP